MRRPASGEGNPMSASLLERAVKRHTVERVLEVLTPAQRHNRQHAKGFPMADTDGWLSPGEVLNTVLVLDCETTGLDPQTDRVLEVAWAVYSVDHVTTVLSASTLVNGAESNPAEDVNGISLEACRAHGVPMVKVLTRLAILLTSVDAVVAHNAPFDLGFLQAEAGRIAGCTPAVDLAAAAPWICSQEDLTWPRQTRERSSLVSLALEHGLGVAHAHRAGADVELLTRLFDQVAQTGILMVDGGGQGYGGLFGTAARRHLLARGLRPKALFQSTLPFERNEEHKARGFKWDAPTKRWLRRMAIEDAAALGWARRVEEEPVRLPGP